MKSSIGPLLNILIKMIFAVLFVLVIAYVLYGDEFKMRQEAKRTHENLVCAFEYVAKNYGKYDYQHRFGDISGKNICKLADNPEESVSPCPFPYTSKLCGVPVDLPEKLNMLSKEALTSWGDPKFIIYWDSYDHVESEYWSGWFLLDVALIFLPVEKVVGIGAKAGKTGLKYVTKFITLPAKMGKAPVKGLRIAARKLGSAIRFISKVGEGEIARGTEINLGEFRNVLDDVIKAYEDAIKKVTDTKTKEELEKQKEAFEKLKKKLDEMATLPTTGTVSDTIRLPPEKDVLKVMGKDTTALGKIKLGLKELITSHRVRVCAPAGVTAALLIDELKKHNIIQCHALNPLTGECEQYYFQGEPIEKELLWVAALTYANNKISAYVLDPETQELKKLTLLETIGNDASQWKLYNIEYDPVTKTYKSEYLGTAKQILENPELQAKSWKSCTYTTAFTFFFTDLAHTMEAKNELYKGEKEKCANNVCLKGNLMSPRPFREEKLQEAMNEAKICGIRMANVDKEGKIIKLHQYFGNLLNFNPAVHEFYLVSPCFAYAQIWVASCDDPTKICGDSELCINWEKDENRECHDDSSNNCCRRCIWVALQRGYGMPFQSVSEFNYCFPAADSRLSNLVIQAPWPHAGYWADLCGDFKEQIMQLLPTNPLYGYCLAKGAFQSIS